MDRKARIAHLAGPNATIQNTSPLVTSNKARAKHDLPLLADGDGKPARFDVLRPQRLAAPVTVYVEQFSAHPLETDAAELYGPPDGYIDSARHVYKERQSAERGNVRNNDASLIELSRRNDWLATVFVILALVGCVQVTPGRNKQRRTVQIRWTTTTGVAMAAGGGGM